MSPNKRSLSAFFLVALMINFTATAYGTCIAVLRTEKYIVVAADSKSTNIIGGVHPEASCKIEKVGDKYFSIAGLVLVEEVHYNAMEMASKSAGSAINLEAATESVEKAVQPFLIRIMEQMRKQFPDYFKKHSENKPIFSIIFYGIESGIPKYYSRQFIVKTNVDNSLKVEVVRQNYNSQGDTDLMYASIGEDNGQGKYFDSLELTPDILSLSNLVNLARNLVEVEIKASPETVGGPIDILQLDEKGEHWVQRKKECLSSK